MNKNEMIKHLLETTELTNAEIRRRVGCRGQMVSDVLKDLGSTYAKDRKRRMYSRSKLGDKNPMKGNTGSKHPRYIGLVDDNKGYWIVLKPEWYTGRKRSKYVFHHVMVYCQNMGMTELPKGHVVHHCNQDKKDNRFDNLLMMTLGEHAALHRALKGATTISKESTAKWLEARRTRKES